MAKAEKPKAARPARKIGFGRREKLVVIGIIGLVAIGALHFLVFKPRSDAVNAARDQFNNIRPTYDQSQGHNFEQVRVEQYEMRTNEFRGTLLPIVGRENFSAIPVSKPPPVANEEFRQRIERLSRKWLAYAATHTDPNTGTVLTFITQQNPQDERDRQALLSGRFRWNIPTGLPPGITSSAIRDALTQARGKYRLIQLVRSDPMPHQLEYNQQLRTLGIPIELIGADHITLQNPMLWEPFRLIPEGVELVRGDEKIRTNPFPPPADFTSITQLNTAVATQGQVASWNSLRLPVPLDSFVALSHIDLLLDALYPPPFDQATMDRAAAQPDSLTPEQRAQYDQWVAARTTERVGDSARNVLGLEELMDVRYDQNLPLYNLALDQVERLVDLAIEDGLSRILIVKMLKPQDIQPYPDPWTPPAPPASTDPATTPMGSAGPSALDANAYTGMEGAVDPTGMFTPAAVEAAAPEPTGFAWVAPIYMQVTGDYSRVMQFFLHLSTGDNFYTVEELSITIQREDGTPFPNLPEGHVVADFWISAPVFVSAIDIATGEAAAAAVAQTPPAPAAPAPAPAPVQAASPELAAVTQ